MKQFIFSHILFATCLAICLSLTTPVSAQDCYGDYIDDVATVTVEFYHPSKSSGAPFTVNKSGKKVIFAGGNLQYNAAQNKWRFAEHQYDIIGDASGSGNITGTKNNGVAYAGTISDRSTQDKWIDLFQWGTSGYHNTIWEDEHNDKDYGNIPPATCTNYGCGYGCEKRYVYQPWDLEVRGNVSGLNANFLSLCKGSLINDSLADGTTPNESDWAWHNAISNGGCEETESGTTCYTSAHQWYVPSSDEMKYVAYTRKNARDLIAFATLSIGGGERHGIILLPDAWTWEMPGADGPVLAEWGEKWTANTPTKQRDAGSENEFKWSDNVLTEAEWEIFEKYGAVFLPAAGAMQFGDWHWYDGWGVVNEYGEYWTSTYIFSGGKPQCRTIRFNTIYGLDLEKYGAFYFGESGRSPLFSCAIRPVRTYTGE